MRKGERLQLVRAKRRRANAHLHQLHKAVKAFDSTRAHSLAVQLYREQRQAEVFAIVSPAELYEISAIAGDYLHNLRSTLDHLAHQLACLVADPPTCKTEFPIYWQPRRFQRDGLSKIECISPLVQQTIESYQPYDRVNGYPERPKEHPLWLLQSMDIEDKHKLLNVVAVAVSFRRLVPKCRNLQITGGRELTTGRLEPGKPVAIYDIIETGPYPQMDVEGYGLYSIVLGEGSLAADEGLFKTLERIQRAVDAVLGALEIQFIEIPAH
jgi:hypothetical protein